MNQRDIETFDKAVESLRQYRRYEIVEEKGDIIELASALGYYP